MSDDRQARLSKLKQAKTSTKIADAKQFGEVLDQKMVQLAEILNEGVEINNLDELINQLGGIKSLEAEVVELKEAISKIELPSSVEIKGLADVVNATKEISKRKDPVVQKIDISVLDQVVDGVGNLIDKVEELKVPKQGQSPEDYVPMRRVMKVGNALMYDDSFYTGGGGGGTTVITEGSTGTSTPPKPTDAYAIANISTIGDYKYFGFMDKDANWYIMRKTVSDSTFLYVAGANDYESQWSNRDSLVYNIYSSVF